jgi:hypothetical protein
VSQKFGELLFVDGDIIMIFWHKMFDVGDIFGQLNVSVKMPYILIYFLQSQILDLRLIKRYEYPYNHYGVCIFSQMHEIGFFVSGFEEGMIDLFYQMVIFDVFEQKREKFGESIVDRFIFFDVLPYLLGFFLIILYSPYCFFRYFIRIFPDFSSAVQLI